MAETYFTCNGKAAADINGGIIMMDIPELPAPAANTLRFSFGDRRYNPVTAGVGTYGTWTKLEHPLNNIWDWTNNNTSWATAFGGGATGVPGAFSDYDHNRVKVIACGDTSSVTNFSRLFQNCYAITEIDELNTSGATNVFIMFSNCTNCSKFPYLDLRNATDVRGIFQVCESMVSAPNIDFPTEHTFSLQNFFMGCCNLLNIPLYNTSMCTNMRAMFQYSNVTEKWMKIRTIPAFDTGRVTTMRQMFGACKDLTTVPLFDTTYVNDMGEMFGDCRSIQTIPAFSTSNVTNMKEICCGCHNLRTIPNWDYSKATDLTKSFYNCHEITTIPSMTLTSVENVDQMFENCEKVSSGSLSMYNYMLTVSGIASHNNTFKNCGINTVSGYAELEQIPQDWGGLQEAVYEGDWVGSYFWSKYCLDYVDSNMTEIDISSPTTETPGISYMLNGGYVYYSPDAIAYLYSHPEVIPDGWHLPTETEAQNFIDTIQAVDESGTEVYAYLESLNLNISVGEGYIINTETYISKNYGRWARNSQESIYGIPNGKGMDLIYAYANYDITFLVAGFYPIRLVKD
jgi:surface protein